MLPLVSRGSKKMMTKNEKVKLLDVLEEGKSNTTVAHHDGENESNIRHIKKDEPKIYKTPSITFNREAKHVYSRNKRIMKMESALAIKIAHCRKKNVSLDTIMIRKKAKVLYENVLFDGNNDSK